VRQSKLKNTLIALSAIIATEAVASTGTIMSGYGIKNITMGGVGTALPLDSIAAANNPAGMAKVGTRVDLGVRVFRGTAHNTFLSEDNENSLNMTTAFPEMGFNYQIDDRTTFGLSMYGSGMLSDYDKPLLPIPGLDDFFANATQITLAPTLTRKFGDSVYIGISPTLNYSVFQAKGVPGIDDKKDTAHGLGVRLGLLWDLTPQFSIGSMYTPRTKMSEFDHYKDNLLEPARGRYDLAEQFSIGFAYKPTDRLTVAADYLRIFWSDVDFLSKKNNGGYKNQNVWRAGVSYDVTRDLTLRGGFSYADNIIDSEFLNANFNGPAISNKSFGLGASYKLAGGYEIAGGIERHIPRSMRGTGQSTGTNLDVNYGFFVLGISKSF
jgi:long-chain fatty acid transport protein